MIASHYYRCSTHWTPMIASHYYTCSTHWTPMIASHYYTCSTRWTPMITIHYSTCNTHGAPMITGHCYISSIHWIPIITSHYYTCSAHLTPTTVFFKTRGHLSRLAWPTQRDGLSCLASPRLALRCAAWPGMTNPDPCSRPVATSGCSHRYYNDIVHNARCINIPFFSVRQAVFLYKHECLK